jgi:hypothetical protein
MKNGIYSCMLLLCLIPFKHLFGQNKWSVRFGISENTSYASFDSGNTTSFSRSSGNSSQEHYTYSIKGVESTSLPIAGFARKWAYSLHLEKAMSSEWSIATGFEIGTKAYSVNYSYDINYNNASPSQGQGLEIIRYFRNYSVPISALYNNNANQGLAINNSMLI